MADISISLTADQANTGNIKGSRTVVIDVLRATSVIITSLANGAKWVRPVVDIDDAWKLKEEYPESILGGERNAIKIEGFDNGNSPFEYNAEKVAGKGVILTTTNGTKALNKSLDANEIMIASFLNLGSVIKELQASDKPIHLLCSGTKGEFSLDDFLCAGGIISGLMIYPDFVPDDLSLLAKKFWESEGSIHDKLKDCKHYNTLVNNGFERDLDYCFSVDTHDVVPRINKESGRIFA